MVVVVSTFDLVLRIYDVDTQYIISLWHNTML
jgi:hypothetical protein